MTVQYAPWPRWPPGRPIDTDLVILVRSVVIHEVAHHFGFSDADIAAIEQDLEPD